MPTKPIRSLRGKGAVATSGDRTVEFKDIEKGFTTPIGRRGTVEYKPNWGQPIVDDQWQGQPGQSGAVDPREFINTSLAQLRDDFKQRADTLKASGLDASVHNRILTGWQDEYDQAKAELTEVTSQFDLIQQSVGAGGMTPESGREAAIRMIVPRETADLMFPSVRPERAGGFTPGQARTNIEAFQEAGEASIINPPGWGKENRKRSDPELLKEQYFMTRAMAGYDAASRADKIAHDLAWDTAQDKNRHTQKTWKQLMADDMEVITSRTYDARLLNIAADKARGSISPLGKALRPKPKTFVSAAVRRVTTPWAPSQFFQTGEQPTDKVRVVSPDGVTGTVDVGELDQYLSQGFRRLQ